MRAAHDAAGLRQAARELGRYYGYEAGHAETVRRISLSLYDTSVALHGFGKDERDLLEVAAILHDIGWSEGRRGHHKSSCERIIAAEFLPADRDTRIVIGLIARYHRKALPQDVHPYYGDLPCARKILVAKLAALLRIGDGLDGMHRNIVRGCTARIEDGMLIIAVDAASYSDYEEQRAVKKADLFEAAYGKKIAIEWGGITGVR